VGFLNGRLQTEGEHRGKLRGSARKNRGPQGGKKGIPNTIRNGLEGRRSEVGTHIAKKRGGLFGGAWG